MSKQVICLVRDGNGDIINGFIVDETPSAQLELSALGRDLEAVGCGLDQYRSHGSIEHMRLRIEAIVKECE